jgi:beta-glucanase (GH16 family)/exo-beta-1,3-glucanase (GH17 family)
MNRTLGALILMVCLVGCEDQGVSNAVERTAGMDEVIAPATPTVSEEQDTVLLNGELLGVAYSGFRDGQHPDRGLGAINPTDAQINEDLDILVDHGFKLIRLYDAGENTETVLRLIRERELPIKVMLGLWLEAEISNHEGCAWLTEPIPQSKLDANQGKNQAEIERGIELAREYSDSVVALNVGNEALVDWTDHLVSLDSVISYVRQVKHNVDQPVTVAENYAWWISEGAPLAAELDFVAVHTYPVWEDKTIDEALAYTVANIDAVQAALPAYPIVILEAGWATQSVVFDAQANEENQHRYIVELARWSASSGIPVFVFEAFDEPWKGDPDKAQGAEKHWGLFNVDRTPKQIMSRQTPGLWYDADAITWAVNVGGEEHAAIDGVRYRADEKISGGSVGEMDDIMGAQDSVVYQSYRSGDLAIQRPIANGSYDITFQFAEPADVAIGQRVFDVQVQGETVIKALDVRLARGNNHLSAVKRTVTDIVVRDGQLDIQFKPIAGEPLLSGVVVRKKQLDQRNWELVWADEFNYSGAPDPSRWNIEIWDAGKVNSENQAYTDRQKNVRVEDGALILEAHREDYQGAQYTSGRIQSKEKGDFLYGRVDFRAKPAAGQGAWSALWMLPTDLYRYASTCDSSHDGHGSIGCDAWPNSGEIDVMEHVGYDMTRVHGTVHNRDFYTKHRNQRKGSIEVAAIDKTFHVYSLEWTPDAIYMFVDGSLYFSYFNEGAGWEAWPYDHPYHLIMNLAVGGWWGRAGGPIDDSIFPTRMEVDYVRVFKPSQPDE